MKICRNLVFVAIFAYSSVAFAQSTSASLTGTVDDPSKALIAGASVTAINTQTDATASTSTNKDGQYVLSGLVPGTYRLEVDKQGFKGIIEAGVTLHVQDIVQINFHLAIGSQSESVTVDASSLQINTSDASVSTVIDRNFVESVPMNGRTLQSLILLTPGVTTASPQSVSSLGYSGEFSVNGQRTESNTYTVDGVNANTSVDVFGQVATGGSLPSATALGTTQSLLSTDALQEVRISSSTYSAEYGLSPGGQFAFESRSGTNQVHGSAFEYFRNDALDANDWFNDTFGLPKQAERQNDFGGTFSGPVWLGRLYDGRNKTFFFFNYEGLRLTQPAAATILYVPSNALRQQTAFALQPVLNAFPLPTGPEVQVACDNVNYLCPASQPTGTLVASGLSPFVEAYSVPSQINSTAFRLDQQLKWNTMLFYRLNYTPSSSASRAYSVVSTAFQTSFTHTLGLTTAFSARINNEFRLNYAFSKGEDSSLNIDNFGGATPANFGQLNGLTAQQAANSDINVAFFFSGFTAPQLAVAQSTNPQHSWNVVDNVTFLRGRHTFKVGYYYRRTNGRLVTFSPDIVYEWLTPQSVIQNTPALAEVVSHTVTYPLYTNTALYAQDELKVNDRLNLSLGLRWELAPAPSTTSGPLPYVTVGNASDPSSLTLAPTGTSLWHTTHLNFAPRLGVAYRIRTEPGKELVFRAGGGVFFDQGQSAGQTAFQDGAPLEYLAEYFGAQFPLAPSQLAVSSAPPYFFVNSIPRNLQLPYTLQWNGSLEQALGRNQAVTVSYVGSNGRRLLSRVYSLVGAAAFDYVYAAQSGTTSSYNALQLQFQRNLSHGLQILASYTWSHSIDFGSQNLDFNQIRGNSDFDVRNNASGALVYDMPDIKTSRVLGALVHGWGVDARISSRSAFPMILDGNFNTLPGGTYAYSGLNLVPNVPVYLHVKGIAGNREINPAAFSLPAANQYGNAPRNFVRGFDDNETDISLRRTFPFIEKSTLQFRAEAFNLPNHPNFGFIDPTYGDPQFGQATMMLNQSIGVLNSLYQQGGPRSLQLALKLAF
jgi:hypothetical protein